MTLPRLARVVKRRSEATMSAEVISLPLWKVTPLRSLKVAVFPSRLIS